MSYVPKTIKGKMNFKNITDEEIMKGCSSEGEIVAVRKFYEKLNGAELILSLWDYDKHESYHLTSWDDKTDSLMMEATFILETNFGAYSDYEEFKKDWEAKEYDPGASIIFPKNCVEELQVLCEESNELSEREKLELINTMEVTEDSSSGGEVEYISVEDNEKNRGILHKIGFTDEDIKEHCYPEDGELDIVTIGFKFANFYDMRNKSFFN